MNRRKIIFAVSISLLLPLNVLSANAAATQADVDYSTQVSKLAQEIGTVADEWSNVLNEAPTLAFGKKYATYKTKASRASNKFLVVIKNMKSLEASPGFAKSGPMLVNAMSQYEKAVNQLMTAINKNDKKMVNKATALTSKANKSYLDWSKTYASEVAMLNG